MTVDNTGHTKTHINWGKAVLWMIPAATLSFVTGHLAYLWFGVIVLGYLARDIDVTNESGGPDDAAEDDAAMPNMVIDDFNSSVGDTPDDGGDADGD